MILLHKDPPADPSRDTLLVGLLDQHSWSKETHGMLEDPTSLSSEGVYVGEGLPPVPMKLAKRIKVCGHGGVTTGGVVAEGGWRASRKTQMWKESGQHIHVAPVFRDVREHSWHAVTGVCPGIYGVHVINSESKQGVHQIGMAELRCLIS